MPDQFVVPQFIDAEDKILGPITARQFVIMLVAFLMGAILWKLLSFVFFLLVFIPLFAASATVAFVKVNGQPFHFFFLNLIQTIKRPGMRVWDKTLTTAELKAHIKEELPPPLPKFARKGLTTSSRLQELTLVVNTGGVYKPEGK